jgi:hypothetical protein
MKKHDVTYKVLLYLVAVIVVTLRIGFPPRSGIDFIWRGFPYPYTYETSDNASFFMFPFLVNLGIYFSPIAGLFYSLEVITQRIGVSPHIIKRIEKWVLYGCLCIIGFAVSMLAFAYDTTNSEEYISDPTGTGGGETTAIIFELWNTRTQQQVPFFGKHIEGKSPYQLAIFAKISQPNSEVIIHSARLQSTTLRDFEMVPQETRIPLYNPYHTVGLHDNVQIHYLTSPNKIPLDFTRDRHIRSEYDMTLKIGQERQRITGMIIYHQRIDNRHERRWSIRWGDLYKFRSFLEYLKQRDM